MTWSPPPRPAWVDELNAFGRHTGGPEALVPLDEASLLAAGRAAAGGLDDLGDDDWRAPFSVLVRSLDEEADLHLVGRLMARNDLVRSLRNRLLVLDAHRRHPGLADEQVTAPVLVCGTGRSGTSILHELLAQDPAHRALLTWEALHPVPAPEAATYATDARIAAADQEYGTFWNLVTPEYGTMHENGGDVPQEDGVLTMPAFLSDHFMGSYPTPSYAAELVARGVGPAMGIHRQQLQLLQWRTPGERWVLKWPGVLSHLRDWFAAYPDTRVVLTHRDPTKVLPSMTSLMATLRWQHTDAVDVAEIVQLITQGTAIVLDLVGRWREEGVLPDEQFVDVRYRDLVDQPAETLRRVYAELGRDLTPAAEAAMLGYLAAKPRSRLGHVYSLDDAGLDAAEVRSLYAAYLDRYDVPEED